MSKPTDPRTQVLLSLLPPGAVFRHCYSDDSLWRPESRGYVNERDPLRAGLYRPEGYYAPWAPPATRLCEACDGTGEVEAVNGQRPVHCGHCGGVGSVDNPDGRPNDHTYTIDAAEYLSKYTVQDGTPLALLLDEVTQLRARLVLTESAMAEVKREGSETERELVRVANESAAAIKREAVKREQAERDLARAGEMRDVSDALPAREVGRVIIVGRSNDVAEEYLSERLMNAGVWHITWIDDHAKAIERAGEFVTRPFADGVDVLTFTAADVSGEFVTHVREDGQRVTLAEWCASVNPGRHASDCEDDEC